ncbi:TonB-dependent receptor [Opitutus terrae]|uniref:TonB-dependent receptor plug n=1 Tax=Opitutus terrae (strain DSM 11246 / JCM 15787 / PB90-1) TaxID=452637 RepID=B1ZY04_OPITP|nr:TonB-dependent receptor [Opitutus terrae]ACB75203.1 TonB-dependent receptor plug [Opitutus terrae PB90-1]
MQLPTRILLLTAVLAAASTLRAQPAASVPSANPADAPPAFADETVRLERFEVTGVPIEDSVNPLTRPLESLFGDSRSVLETPRSASTITQALLRERGIEGVREFVAFAPGSYAPASYGKATIPNIRGDLAETFLNGQRLSYNNFGVMPSFNGVEAVDIVRGPGSAIYGSGFFTGGYVNYTTKRPKFTRETTVTARLGSWVPRGGSWLNGSWQVDTTAPAADGKSAWRFSYEGKEDDTFFKNHGGRDDRQDLFASWIREANDALTLEANAQYMWQATPQLLGVNRPNQELIDHGRYYTGDLPDLGYSDAGALAGTIPGTTWVDLPRDATLLSVGDFSNANIVRGQFIATLQLAPEQKLVNRTLAEYVDRRRYHAFEYAEWAEQTTFENRTEWHASFEQGGLAHAVIAGGTLRWEDRLGYTNYFNEYFFQYDLTRPNRVFSHTADYPNSYWPGFAGPGGRLFFPASYGSPETTDSTLWNPALFAQDEVRFSEKLSLLAGVRLDGFYAKATDPLGTAAENPWSDTHRDTATSWNASLIYRVTPKATLYATHQRAYAVHGNVTGGGIMLKEDAQGRGIIDPDDFKNLSKLTEAGVKLSLLENTLYAGAAVYEQHRQEVELGGDVKNLKFRGAEVELVYQPTTRFNATFNAAFIDGRFDHSSATQAGGPSLYNLYAAGHGPGGRGNGLGFQWDKLPPGDYRIPGLSRWVVNSSFSYRFPSGFGGGLGGSWQSEQPGNLTNEYHIPAQVFLNAFLFYRQPTWEVDVEILNVLDRRNWIHNGDNYSNNVLVFQDLPLRVEGYVKFRF